VDHLDDARLQDVLVAAINAATHEQIFSVPMEWTIDQIGVDSITLSEIIFHIEDALGIEIGEATLLRMVEASTVGEFFIALRECAHTQAVSA
jgi:acyl carrier protein